MFCDYQKYILTLDIICLSSIELFPSAKLHLNNTCTLLPQTNKNTSKHTLTNILYSIQYKQSKSYRGPLLICLALGVLLSFKAPTNQASLVFAAVFCTVWLGSAVVTVNAQLLGGTISFFQSVCVLGYCIFPMTLAAFIIDCLKLTWFRNWTWIDLILIGVGFLWATRASSVFIGLYVVKERRFLAVFPVLFFYTFVGWMILLF